MKSITKKQSAKTKQIIRCEWCGDDELYVAYHDKEWGVPLHNDEKLFELLALEGAQAGLSWLTVLRKRQGYITAFNKFNLAQVAKFTDKNVTELLNNRGIIRNKLKVLSVIKNAQTVLQLQKEFGSFDYYLWKYVDGKTIKNGWTSIKDLPSSSDLSFKLSKDLKKRGMNFVGSTICYSFMQSSGMINDHIKTCFRYEQL